MGKANGNKDFSIRNYIYGISGKYYIQLKALTRNIFILLVRHIKRKAV